MRFLTWLFFLCSFFFSIIARADYVGELETTKYFDSATVALAITRFNGGTGFLAGDEISYIIKFTPTNNGGMGH